MRILFLVTVWVLASLDSSAQSFEILKHDRRWIGSFGSGITTYFGDLRNSGEYFDTRPNIMVGLERKLNHKWSARAEVGWYSIDGSDTEANDPGRRDRNLSFRSNNFELNAVALWGVFREGKRFYQRRSLNPYLFAGLGLSWINPLAEYEGETYALRPLETENVSYGRVIFVIPVGAGLKFKINNHFNLNLEAGFRATFSDYIDDVSTAYIDQSDITDPVRMALIDRRAELNLPLAEVGSNRGNADANDSYAMLNFKFEYYLPTDLIFPPKDAQKIGPGKRKHRRTRDDIF